MEAPHDYCDSSTIYHTDLTFGYQTSASQSLIEFIRFIAAADFAKELIGFYFREGTCQCCDTVFSPIKVTMLPFGSLWNRG